MTAAPRTSRIVFVGAILLTVAAAAVFILNGRSEDLKVSTSPNSAATGPAATRPANDDGYVSPLSHFLIGDGLTSTFEQNLERQILQCMTGRGWKYTQRVGVVIPSEPARVGELRKFRHENGYTTPTPAGFTNNNDDPNEKYYRSLDRQQRARYLEDLNAGDSEAGGLAAAPTGCRPAAEAALQANLPLSDPAVSNAVSEAMDRVTQDPRLEAARGEWRSCMASNGYQYKKLDDPRNEMRQRTADAAAQGRDVEAARAAEITVATADIDCAVRTTIAVRQELEDLEVAGLKQRFPQYGSR